MLKNGQPSKGELDQPMDFGQSNTTELRQPWLTGTLVLTKPSPGYGQSNRTELHQTTD